jgi:hypothetical protein
VTRTGYTIDLSQISSTIDLLRLKYDEGNQDISCFRAKNKFKDEYTEKQIDESEFKMEPKEFGAIVKTILDEKLCNQLLNKCYLGIPNKGSKRHLYDHVDADVILKQKDQIVKQYRLDK